MPLTPGVRLGPYEVTAKLGEGGMGEVYRATDTKLEREVAIKVLPAAFVEDHERLARFDREAKLLAQLHHPNIASIFGMEESEGTQALVMELVEGPTLADRLKSGSLPLEESLSIARQIAEALEEAHEKGIIHRDLKPQNIKASSEGKVKVLDFGLAKAMDPMGAVPEGGSASQLAQSPTLTLGATQMGMILGTAAYMAPEQAKGFTVDKRCDIWAFGVVLYEMLSGGRLFEGDSVPDTLARVLQRKIDFDALPSSTPPAIRRLLRRCLERNPKNRLRDIGDARLTLDETRVALTGIEPGSAPASSPSRRAATLLPWALAVAASALAGWALLVRAEGGRASRELTRLELSLPAGVEPYVASEGFSLSPDGRSLAMIGVHEGIRRLYLRRLDSPDADELTDSIGVTSSAFSPDGSSIAFVAGDAALLRLSLVDQQRTVVASGVDLASSLVWGQGGIYFSRGGALWLAPTGGGAERQLTRLDETRHEVLHSAAVELPGSRAVLFVSLTAAAEKSRIESVGLEGGARSVIVEGASSPVWSATTGHLLFARNGSILAVPFDPRRGSVTGSGVKVFGAGEVGTQRYEGLVYRLSASGTLVLMPPEFAEERLVSVARDGAERDLGLPPGSYSNPRVSPDGGRLLVVRAFSVVEELDLARGTRTQLSAPAFGTDFSTWTSDGDRVVFRRFGLPQWFATDGSGRSGAVANGTVNDYPASPGPDANTILAVRVEPETSGDLYLESIDGATPPKPLLATAAYEGGPELSPDGKWLLYQSNVSSQPEIYVRRYPALDRAWQVSEGGGAQTRWSADGREIYYRSGHQMMAASFDGRGTEPVLGRPAPLFDDQYEFGQGISIANYDVGKDGHLLLLRRTPAGGRLHVLLNWDQELERLIAAGGVR